jgi:hypothetical protein
VDRLGSGSLRSTREAAGEARISVLKFLRFGRRIAEFSRQEPIDLLLGEGHLFSGV